MNASTAANLRDVLVALADGGALSAEDAESAMRTLFAGEATTHHHSGYVGGALETGVREARRLLGIAADLTLD